MKKATLTLMTLTLFSLVSFSQSQKMVLLEHFTQASCGPCFTYNPAIQTMLEDPQNTGRVTSIKYQTSWPGYDPMHDHNPSEVNNRVSYYGVTSVPNSTLGGNYYNGHPVSLNQNAIDSIKGTTSPFEIKLTYSYNDNLDEITVRMVVIATGAVTGDLRAQIAVIEENISFSSSPGNNGETEFYNVMKKMLPDENGTTLPSTMNIGDSVVITESWDMKNIYDEDEIAVVAFVQNNVDKYVYQAAEAKIPYIPIHTLNLQPVEISGLPVETCVEEVTPDFNFRNRGATTITSASFEYSINGGALQTYDWTGSLVFNDEVTVSLGNVPYVLTQNNVVEIYPTSVNSGIDNFTLGDTITSAFAATEEFNAFLNFETAIYTGGEATKWQLFKSDGSIYAESQIYDDGVTYKEQVGIKVEDCYKLVFSVDNGNGDFDGAFQVKDGDDNLVMFVLSSSETYTVKDFTVNALTLSVEDEFEESLLNIYPNPTNGTFNIRSNITTTANILDITGKIIKSISVKEGKESTVNGLKPGVYFVKINSFVEKVIIN